MTIRTTVMRVARVRRGKATCTEGVASHHHRVLEMSFVFFSRCRNLSCMVRVSSSKFDPLARQQTNRRNDKRRSASLQRRSVGVNDVQRQSRHLLHGLPMALWKTGSVDREIARSRDDGNQETMKGARTLGVRARDRALRSGVQS